MAEWITSKTNATVQLVRKLMASRKYRYEYRAFVADGAKLAEEALRWGLGVDALLLREGVDFPVPAGVRELRVPEGLMREISRMETPQGVLALCRMPEPAPLELVPGSLTYYKSAGETFDEIHNEVFGSDHCPVELEIDL